MGAKATKKLAPLAKEWADMVLFANYETYVVKEGSGDMKKAKAKGGKRVMYTTHHPCWDAKNRKGFPEKIDFDFSAIANAIPARNVQTKQETYTSPPPLTETSEPAEHSLEEISEPKQEIPVVQDESGKKQLYDLMNAHGISRAQIQNIVSKKGYFPADMPIENYPEDYIKGVLVGAWDQVHQAILDEEIPF